MRGRVRHGEESGGCKVSYAQDTSVSVEKSRAELETILSKYGASRFGYMTDTDRRRDWLCTPHGKAVKFVLPLPSTSEFAMKFRYKARVQCSPEEMHRNWEQACRSRWRALCLCVKAKLEAVECGITSFEQEFLAHFVMPNGSTFGDYAIPKIEEATKSGKMPALQLTG